MFAPDASSMANQKCSKCGSSRIAFDDQTYQQVCRDCHFVMGDEYMVQSTFIRGKDGFELRGKTIAVGDSTDISWRYFGAQMPRQLFATANEQAEREAKRRFQETAQMIGPMVAQEHVLTRARRIWKSCYSQKITRRYSKKYMTAVCLYMSCRDEKIPYLLIDFALACDVNMFRLSRYFYRVCRDLPYPLKILDDPTIFVERFVCELQLPDPKVARQIAATACKLVSRMKRDYIHTGRRPSGVCGACIVLAARMHGHPLSLEKVVRVVKLSEGTIRKRLTEFLATPAANMTVEEFQRDDIEQSEKWKIQNDPPSFIRNVKKRQKERRKLKKKGSSASPEEKDVVTESSASAVEQKQVDGEVDTPFNPFQHTIYDEHDPYFTTEKAFLETESEHTDELSCDGGEMLDMAQLFDKEFDDAEDTAHDEDLPFSLDNPQQQRATNLPDDVKMDATGTVELSDDEELGPGDDDSEVEREILPEAQVTIREKEFQLLHPDYGEIEERRAVIDKQKAEREKRKAKKRRLEVSPSDDIARKVQKMFAGSVQSNHDIVKKLLAGESLTQHHVNVDDDIEVNTRKVDDEPNDAEDVSMPDQPSRQYVFNPLES